MSLFRFCAPLRGSGPPVVAILGWEKQRTVVFQGRFLKICDEGNPHLVGFPQGVWFDAAAVELLLSHFNFFVTGGTKHIDTSQRGQLGTVCLGSVVPDFTFPGEPGRIAMETGSDAFCSGGHVGLIEEDEHGDAAIQRRTTSVRGFFNPRREGGCCGSRRGGGGRVRGWVSCSTITVAGSYRK